MFEPFECRRAARKTSLYSKLFYYLARRCVKQQKLSLHERKCPYQRLSVHVEMRERREKLRQNCTSSQRIFRVLNEAEEMFRSLRFTTFVYLAIVCSLEAQHKKFIRRLYVVKACRACFFVRNLLCEEKGK